MKVLKKVLLVLAIVIAIPLIAALFVKKEFNTERSVIINKPQQEVFNYVKYLKNQENYSVWFKIDPDMKRSYQGEDGTVGFLYSWDSKNRDLGKGEQEITHITGNERIDSKLRFTSPMESEMDAYMIVEAQGIDETKVRWGVSGRMPYPLNLMSLFYDMGQDLDKGLQNLKTVLEP